MFHVNDCMTCLTPKPFLRHNSLSQFNPYITQQLTRSHILVLLKSYNGFAYSCIYWPCRDDAQHLNIFHSCSALLLEKLRVSHEEMLATVKRGEKAAMDGQVLSMSYWSLPLYMPARDSSYVFYPAGQVIRETNAFKESNTLYTLFATLFLFTGGYGQVWRIAEAVRRLIRARVSYCIDQ